MYNILKDISWAWKYAQFVEKKAKKTKMKRKLEAQY